MMGRLAVAGGALLIGALAMLSPNASAASTAATGTGRAAAVLIMPIQLDAADPCPVLTGTVIGGCPRPLVASRQQPRAELSLCPRIRQLNSIAGGRGEPMLCGRGFRLYDRVDVVVDGPYGSTLWRAATDGRGAFRSALPVPLCALTPSTLFAADSQGMRSRPLVLAGHGCPS
jgi:hypothetical protein